MPNINIVLFTVLLVGCGTAPASTYDAGMFSDAEVTYGEDAATISDSGSDAGEAGAASPDTGTTIDASSDSGSDAGLPPDAEPPSDAGIDSEMTDGSPADAGVGSEVVDLGVSGNGSCLLTDTNEMWCWGNGTMTPTYVADVIAIEGTCGLGIDRRIVCWNPMLGGAAYDNGPGTPTFGSNVELVGRQVLVGRSDGLVHRFQMPEPTWDPPGTIVEMPALNCAIFNDGALTCWDAVRVGATTNFSNFWNAVEGWQTYDVQDVARRGTFESHTSVVCFAWTGSMPTAGGGSTPGPNIYCATERGTTGSPLFARGSEIEMAGGRACAMTPSAPAGEPAHPAGVYCTADRPAALTESGYWPLNPLPVGDPYMNEYTNVMGTHLSLGLNHACVMQGDNILCWGDNSLGQLGDGTTASSRTPTMVVW